MKEHEILTNEIMSKLEDNPDVSVEAIRLVLKYLLFDLEATRRERDELRSILEDQP